MKKFYFLKFCTLLCVGPRVYVRGGCESIRTWVDLSVPTLFWVNTLRIHCAALLYAYTAFISSVYVSNSHSDPLTYLQCGNIYTLRSAHIVYVPCTNMYVGKHTGTWAVDASEYTNIAYISDAFHNAFQRMITLKSIVCTLHCTALLRCTAVYVQVLLLIQFDRMEQGYALATLHQLCIATLLIHLRASRARVRPKAQTLSLV